jgi:alanine dehydrogenase
VSVRIGVIKEIKDQENRVALTPSGAHVLVQAGHTVMIQEGAGVGSGFTDAAFREAGACIVNADSAWDADLVLKVKEPLESEYRYLKAQLLFTYLHLAGVDPALTEALLRQKTTAVAYETVEDPQGSLPLLAPMSAIAGNMAVTIGNYYLSRVNQGKGIQLGMVLGHRYGKVVMIGDGVVAQHAARTAAAMGAHVFIGGRQRQKVWSLEHEGAGNVHFFRSQPARVAAHLHDADLVVGAVLLRGARAPHVVTEDMVKGMQAGSVIVDVSIDQGGCVATSRATTHSAPVFVKHEVTHYCVTNMPGAYPHTATLALTTATLPYVLQLARQGADVFHNTPGLAKGLNTYRGYITCRPVAEALHLTSQYKPFADL